MVTSPDTPREGDETLESSFSRHRNDIERLSRAIVEIGGEEE